MTLEYVILSVAVIMLAILVYGLKKEINDRTSLYVEEGRVGEKIIRNAKGEIILEL